MNWQIRCVYIQVDPRRLASALKWSLASAARLLRCVGWYDTIIACATRMWGKREFHREISSDECSFVLRKRRNVPRRHRVSRRSADYIEYYDRREHMRSFVWDNHDRSPRSFTHYLRNNSSRPWHGNVRRNVSFKEKSDCIAVLCNSVSLLY